jgi:hypothetical protein
MTEAQKERAHLFEYNAEAAAAHQRLQRDGVAHPVVFVIDARDEQGPQFWRATHGGTLEGFTSFLAQHAQNTIPIEGCGWSSGSDSHRQ